METAMKVRCRILINNESIRSVAKQTDLSRNTIRKYCRDDQPPKYKRCAPNFSPRLKGFEDRLKERKTGSSLAIKYLELTMRTV